MKAHLVLAFAVADVFLMGAFSQASAQVSNAVVLWSQPVEGVSVRLRPDKTRWASNETATFKLDLRNEGQRVFYTTQSQEPGRLEVDGVGYDWTGAFDLKSSWFPPGREYRDIPVSLGVNWKATQEWRDKTQAPPPQIPLKLLPGKHTIRFAPEIRDITVKPKPRNVYVPSNPVEVEIVCDLKNPAEDDAPEKAVRPYEIVIIDDRVTFDKAENISMGMVIRDLCVKKMIAPDLYWGLSVVWDGKEYKRDPKHKRDWNGPWEIIPKTAWRTGFSLSEYRVPAAALTAGRHTITLKDAFSESNTLTVFIEPTNR